MAEQTKVTTLEKVVIRFSGDSGDGMQLTGTIFSNLSAIFGNEISTFPDYPAEVRAPQGTLSGVSGFQVHLGSRKIFTPGDKADVLVAMNPAALKVNVKNLKPNAIVLIDTDSFQKSDLDKAQFTTDDPFQELGLGGVQVVAAPISTMVKDGLAEFGLDNKSALRCKNMFALGLVCWLFERPLDEAMHMLQNKFAKKPAIAQANIKALTDGYNYGHNIHASVSTYRIESKKAAPGFYSSNTRSPKLNMKTSISEKGYEERILRDIESGITLEILTAKKHKKTPEEKAVIRKQKKRQRRAKRKKKAREKLTADEILQDDRFFFIVGYTSGGAPYGVTWEEMGMEPWEHLKENE